LFSLDDVSVRGAYIVKAVVGATIMIVCIVSFALCLKRGYLTGYEANLGKNSVLLGVVANHPLKFFDVLRDAAHTRHDTDDRFDHARVILAGASRERAVFGDQIVTRNAAAS
jgi:hypothetical protein